MNETGVTMNGIVDESSQRLNKTKAMVENDNSIMPLVVADISEIVAEGHNKNITANIKY